MMILPKFDFHEPATLEEACQVMAELSGRARLLAGGTDLLVNMKKKLLAPENLVSIARIEQMNGISSSGEEISLGGGMTAADLAESAELKKAMGALYRAAGGIGSPLIRNRATLGGNLVTARPAADLPPALMVYDADLVLKSSSGERTMAVAEFFKGPGETVIAQDEILTGVVAQSSPPLSGAGYVKLGVRQAMEIALVNIAVFMTLDKPEGVIKTARVAMGSVAPVPIRAPSAERVLIGEKPSETLFEKAGEAAAGDSKPITDFRASAEYKRQMIKVLTKRALNQALEEAKTNS
jgi:carbon-monoxide dehydrogenase medium subunit